MKKNNRYFELTGESKINDHGVKLFRIKCIKELPGVKVGTIGGWIEKPENLSEMAWVGDEAQVFGDAKVYGYAQVFGDAKVYGYAQVFGYAKICEYTQVYNYAQVFGHAWVFGHARVYNYAQVFGEAQVFGYAQVYEYAQVFGLARIFGYARISGKANISSTDDYCCFQSFGSQRRTTTVFREVNKGFIINCGCFSGTLEKFEETVQRRHGDNKFGKEYKAIIEVIKVRFVA